MSNNYRPGDFLYQFKWDGMRWITVQRNTLKAVSLGMIQDTELRYVGAVSSGITRILHSEAVKLIQERASSPFKHSLGPIPSRGETIRWVGPTLLLKTRFLV